jgi:cell wall-associated NlpC family hydrolase
VATRRPSALRVFSLLVAISATLTLGPALASAAAPTRPDPGSGRAAIEAAKAELDALQARMDSAVEDYDGSRVALSAAKRKAAAALGRVSRAQAHLAKLQQAIGELAAAAYRSGGTDPLVQLVNASSPESYLNTATSMDQIARGQSQQLREIKNARRELTNQQTASAQILAAQTRIERHMAAVKSDIEAAVARQSQLLDVLETKEARRVRLAAEATARAAALAAEAARRARASVRASRSVSRGPIATYSGPASGRAAIAVREAYRQLGKPYRWGASGPDSFDCSGLMMWVWGKAGVSLPHSSRAQYGAGMHVSQSELQPGDLVFYGSPIHHVGIYVGGGQYIDAPHTGAVVRVGAAFRGDYAGAVRL